MKKSNIYTRSGDKGKTGLISGERVDKNDIRIEAYGTVDELSSHIGMLASLEIPMDIKDNLRRIQNLLFCVGSQLALGDAPLDRLGGCVVTASDVGWIEQEIDKMDSQLPSMKSFVLPGGTQMSAEAHICRTVCRRAERRILSLMEKSEVSDELLSYINRLSDYFFVLARQLNFIKGVDEIIWAKSCRSE